MLPARSRGLGQVVPDWSQGDPSSPQAIAVAATSEGTLNNDEIEHAKTIITNKTPATIEKMSKHIADLASASSLLGKRVARKKHTIAQAKL